MTNRLPKISKYSPLCPIFHFLKFVVHSRKFEIHFILSLPKMYWYLPFPEYPPICETNFVTNLHATTEELNNLKHACLPAKEILTSNCVACCRVAYSVESRKQCKLVFFSLVFLIKTVDPFIQIHCIIQIKPFITV